MQFVIKPYKFREYNKTFNHYGVFHKANYEKFGKSAAPIETFATEPLAEEFKTRLETIVARSA